MLDRFNRTLNYLRLSVTDRCNLRCIYCMPEQGVSLKNRRDILSYEQIEAVAREAALLGVTKIRLTGGEPLIRKDMDHLVERLASIPGIKDLCMTTNGSCLALLADRLKRNGLQRVNISLDSIDPGRYRSITRGGDILRVLEGIDAARVTGLTPVKINMVVLESTHRQEVEQMQSFCAAKGLYLQTIRRFSLLQRENTAARTTIADRPPDCRTCNKMRLTADGYLKPCLFSNSEIAVDFRNIRRSLVQAAALKPFAGNRCSNRSMSQIGG